MQKRLLGLIVMFALLATSCGDSTPEVEEAVATAVAAAADADGSADAANDNADAAEESAAEAQESAEEAAESAAAGHETAEGVTCPDVSEVPARTDPFDAWWDDLNELQRELVWAATYEQIYPATEFAVHKDVCGRIVCAYSKNEIVTAIDFDPSDFEDLATLEPTDDDEEAAALELVGLKSYKITGGALLDQPLALVQEILDIGILAGPDYVVTPSMGRMLFPGTYPVPADFSALDPSPEERTTIHIFDTGAWDGDGEFGLINYDNFGGSGRAMDQYIYQAAPAQLHWSGHGSFIGSVIGTIDPAAQLAHWRINDIDALAWTEVDVLERAIDGREVADANGEPMLSNLSLGTVACEHDEADQVDDQISIIDDRVDPVVWGGVMSVLLKNPDDGLVAAAGNTGRATRSYPAFWAVGSDFADQILSVGSTEAHSTDAPWVELVAPGCHVGAYPGLEYGYPQPTAFAPPSMSIVGFNTGGALWCGSSFATAVVSASVALRMSEGYELRDIFADPEAYGLEG